MSQSKQEASATARASDAENSKYDIDPADTTRRVPHKRINNAYYVHQRWLEEQARKERAREEHKQRVMRGGRKQEDEEETNMTWGNAICSALFTALLAVIMGVLMGMFIHGDPLWGHRSKWINLRTYFPHIYTPEELAQYNGEKRRKPILLAIKGTVFDVTKGARNYGPGGAYHFFAGRDASRAFVTGCFQTHLTHDVRGLSPHEELSLEHWYNFFDKHPDYFKVGRVRNPYISPGAPIPPPCNHARNQKPGM